MKTVHLKFSPEELEEIDAWKNERRIRTRSEAIRRLIRDSLANYDKSPKVPPRIVPEPLGFNDSLIKNTVRNVIAEDTALTSLVKDYVRTEMKSLLDEEISEALKKRQSKQEKDKENDHFKD